MAGALLVEDHVPLAKFLRGSLRELGLEVDVVGTERSALRKVLNEDYDLVVLDLMLPDGSGLDVLARLRGLGDRTPVLIISARDAVPDRVSGLDAGADDYLVKPFSVDEFAARARALLRRPERFAALTVGDLSLDPVARRASANGHEIAFTPKEFDVLLVLARNAPRAVGRTAILEAAWQVQSDGLAHTLEAHVSAIRRRLRVARCTAAIETVRRVGYRLVDTDAADTAGAD